MLRTQTILPGKADGCPVSTRVALVPVGLVTRLWKGAVFWIVDGREGYRFYPFDLCLLLDTLVVVSLCSLHTRIFLCCISLALHLEMFHVASMVYVASSE